MSAINDSKKGEIFSLGQVVIATVVASYLSGLYMLAANYRQAKDNHWMIRIAIIGIVFTVIYIWLFFQPIFNMIPDGIHFLIHALFILGVSYFGKYDWTQLVDDKKFEKKSYLSVIKVCVSTYLVLVMIFVIWIILT